MKKERILKAAEKLFVEKGFEGTSIRELAQSAGVNIAMISYYFGSKEKLLEELVAFKAGYTRIKLEELNKKKDLSALEKLEHVLDYYVNKIFTNRKFHVLIHRELTLSQRSELHDSILKILSRNWDQFRRLIEEGQQNGAFKKDVDIDLVIMTVFGLINQCSRQEIFEKINDGNKHPDEKKVKTRIKTYLYNLIKDHLTT